MLIKFPIILFTEKRKQQSKNSHGHTNDPEKPKQSWAKRAKLEISIFNLNVYGAKVTKHYGTGRKTDSKTNETD
jgi:hypothetical protein